MDKENVNITEKTIGDTIYIVYSESSANARETVISKIERMILREYEEAKFRKAS